VLDKAGAFAGIITESDLFIKGKNLPFSVVKIPHMFYQSVEPQKLTAIYADVDANFASDVMSLPVITISPEAEVGEGA